MDRTTEILWIRIVVVLIVLAISSSTLMAKERVERPGGEAQSENSRWVSSSTLKTVFHRHPLLDFIRGGDHVRGLIVNTSSISNLKDGTDLFQPGTGELSLDHLWAYSLEYWPTYMPKGFGYTAEEVQLMLLKNTRVDLFMGSVAAKISLNRMGLDIINGTPIFSEPVRWPHELTLGLHVTYSIPEKLIRNNTAIDLTPFTIEIPVRLVLIDDENPPLVVTYRILDPVSTGASLTSAASDADVQFQGTHFDQELEYAYLKGFTPSMFMSNTFSKTERGDTLYYTIRTGPVSVKMGLQSVSFQRNLSPEELSAISEPSFVRF